MINSHNDSILSSPPTLLPSLVDDASFPATNPAKKETLETVDPRLQDIVERMFRKCYETEDYKPAIGIAIEARRLDVVEEGIKLASQRSRERKGKVKEVEDEKDGGVELMDYVLDITMGVVQEIGLREKVCCPAHPSSRDHFFSLSFYGEANSFLYFQSFFASWSIYFSPKLHLTISRLASV